jgi:hypothetical protein
MIRRQVGQEYWLISQDDHARVSGQLAAKLGNDAFDGPSPESSIRGIALHDCGWPLHDERPTLNAQHIPLDVFEAPRAIGLRVWQESADRAAATGDGYAALLVSLHALSLSVFATVSAPIQSHRWNMNDPRTRFEVNRFQHNMIALQDVLRRRLGMRVDRPLKHGLAEEPSDHPPEQRLTFDFRWLQAMDKLSLCICCTRPPFGRIEPVLPSPGTSESVAIRVTRPSDDVLMLDPWPFAGSDVGVEVPFRRITAQPFTDDEAFRAAYAAAGLEQFRVVLRPESNP